MKEIILMPVIFATLTQWGFAEPLYTQNGEDPSFQEVMHSGKLPKGIG